MKNELAMREKMSERAQLLDKTKTLLEECQQERDRTATDDLPFVQQENYGAWRYKAQLAVDNAKSMLADEAGNAPFFKENPGLRQTLAAWRPLGRTMREERRGLGTHQARARRAETPGAAPRAGARGSRCDAPSAAAAAGKPARFHG